MSKKYRNYIRRDNCKAVEFLNRVNSKHYTILAQFQLFLKETPTVSDIIDFLSLQNAFLLTKLGKNIESLDQKTAMEVLEFFEYFMDNYDDLTYEARMNNWGEADALIIRVGAALEEKIARQERQALLDSMTEKQKQEAKTLKDTLMEIRKKRMFSFVIDEEFLQMEFPATIRKSELQYYEEELYAACAMMICNYGAVTVRIFDNGIQEIFGIRVLPPFQVWSPISKEEMLDAHTLSPDGTRLAPEPGVTYTEIMREKF